MSYSAGRDQFLDYFSHRVQEILTFLSESSFGDALNDIGRSRLGTLDKDCQSGADIL